MSLAAYPLPTRKTGVGAEFLDVSGGIDLDGVSERETVARSIEGHNLPIFA